MTDKEKTNIQKEVISSLLRKSDAQEKWGIYNLGVRVNVGKSRIYNSKGMARRRLIDTTCGTDYIAYSKEYKETKEKVIDDLIEKGLIEIRKLNDVSPLFPYNIIKDKEMADRIAKMVASSDGELFDLALTIVEGIKNK
jgi:hypothetical protein